MATYRCFFFFKIINIAYHKKLNDAVLKKLGFFVIACILGLAISLLIYLPSIEYSDFSIRGASSGGGAKYNYATSWSFHPKEILTFLLPSAFGFGGQAYWGLCHLPIIRTIWELLYYCLH